MTTQTSHFDYEILVRYMLPQGFLDTFEVTRADEECTGTYDETNTEIRILHIYLDIRDLRDDVWHDQKPNGFTEARVFNDFPVREHKVALHVRRRRWLSDDGKNQLLDTPAPLRTAQATQSSLLLFLKKWLDTYPVTAQCVARFFRNDGRYLNRAYKEHLSDFKDWEQKDHATEWVLFVENMGTHLSIDESMLHNVLFTFLSNKAGHGKHGMFIAAVKGTTIAEVTMRLMAIPEEKRLAVKEVTMDFSDSMMGIVKQVFPNAEIVIDCFHIMQLAGKGLEEMRMKLKRTAVAERKKQERKFKKLMKAISRARAYYAKHHTPKKSKNGNTMGRPGKRKNEKFQPEILANGETKVELLPHVRYPLLKSGNDWTDCQKKGMIIFFGLDRRIKSVYGLVCALRNIFKRKLSRKKAEKALHTWYKNVGRSRIRELIAVRDTIKGKQEYVLNYFNNRSTNASAESLNSKTNFCYGDFASQLILDFLQHEGSDERIRFIIRFLATKI